MVCRTHKYADGGKIVKDHLAPAPTPKPTPSSLGTGMAAKAAGEIKSRKSKIDEALEAAGA